MAPGWFDEAGEWRREKVPREKCETCDGVLDSSAMRVWSKEIIGGFGPWQEGKGICQLREVVGQWRNKRREKGLKEAGRLRKCVEV